MLRTFLSKIIPPEYKFKIKSLLGKTLYFDWSELSKEINQINKSLDNKSKIKIAFMTSSGGHRPGNLLEPALALALKRRGFNTASLICDSSLSACNITEFGNQSNRLETFLKSGPKGTKTCEYCETFGINTWKTSGVKLFKFSDFIKTNKKIINPKELIESKNITFKGINIKEHIVSASLRFLCRGSFDWDAPETEKVIIRYYIAACEAVEVAQNFFDTFSPNVMICFHGIYIPHGIFGAVARKRGIRVINWNTSYRKRRILISEDDTYHKAMCYEKEQKWNIPLSLNEQNKIIGYLNSREEGKQDWQQFNENPNKDILYDKELIDFKKNYPRIFLLLPNVIWDAQLQYEPTIYETMKEWVVETIKIFINIKKSGLIIRIHPAEIRRYSTSREPLLEIIEKNFPEGLPQNIKIINANENHSTYRLSEICSAAIIFGTKTGLELSARGIPVIVCGEAWIKDKNISFDPKTKEEYENLLKVGNLKMTSSMKERAIRFAYHFFERTALELPFLGSISGNLTLTIDEKNIDVIANGKNKVLEKICDEIEAYTGYFIGG